MKLSGRSDSSLTGILALDGFHWQGRLGRGRFGTCYTVSRDTQDYVLKIFNANDVKRRKDKLTWEIFWLKEIDHPAIPKLIQVLDRDGFYGLIMEKRPGNSLEELLDWDYNFQKTDIIAIMNQLIAVNCYLEAMNISHRDIKTSNILWTGRELSLIDFGSARKRPLLRTRFNLDFWGIGDVFIRLAAGCQELTPGNNGFSVDQLNLNTVEKQLIKRLLYLDKPYANFADLQKSFVQIFL